MTQQDLHELARKGNSRAISALLNQQFKASGVRSKAVIKQGCLHVILEAEDDVPDRPSCLETVRIRVVNWEVEGVDRVRVYGRQTGHSVAAWQQEFAVAVGGYSNFLFSQSQGATGSPDVENSQEDKASSDSMSPTSHPHSHPPSRLLLKVLLLLGMLLMAVGAYFILEQSQSDESNIDSQESQEF
ncbi:hypothetical protein NEA10_04120 [Phormidium yuhuli AB48]|uniref:Uncharacterized protein n=1 Tax=Phormidium yuhuli AB48 TaxID=2940671 RepID=A0ABY5AUW3_9CYAN|nr:hypothetical protein [Phormidium yuhuli]USR91923.1 hypothetical protein NEA10_04120 [Phormidium yuhuli AB48]